MGAELLILDPALTISTPKKIWLSSGIRSVDHCVEGLCSFHATAENDIEATKGLRLLVPNLLVTMNEWESNFESWFLPQPSSDIAAMIIVLSPIKVWTQKTACPIRDIRRIWVFRYIKKIGKTQNRDEVARGQSNQRRSGPAYQMH